MGKSAKLYKKKDIVELIKTYMGSKIIYKRSFLCMTLNGSQLE
jgi:hypothetical protein